MPEFAQLQQNAKGLTAVVNRILIKKQGCINFFSTWLITADNPLDYAVIISELAHSLDDENDQFLIRYLTQLGNGCVVSKEECEQFKLKVLTGIYLVKWSQYANTATSFIDMTLVELFQADLEIASPSDLNKETFQSCLDAFSHYCTFIYNHQSNGAYNQLNEQLVEMQVDIFNVRHPKPAQDYSWYGMCSGVTYMLGISDMS